MTLDDVQLKRVIDMQDVMDFFAWTTSGPLQSGVLGVDTETTGLSRWDDRVRLVQVGDLHVGWAMEWERWSGLVTDLLTRYSGRITMFNAPFDRAQIAHMGVDIERNRIDDVQPLLKLIEPHKWGGLKPASSRWVDPRAGAAQKELDAAIKKYGWDGININFGPYWQYAALDPVLTTWLWRKLREAMSEEMHHGYDVENAVLWVLDAMTDRGIPVDVDYAQAQMSVIQSYCNEATRWCRDNYNVAPGSNAAIIRRLQDAGYEFSKLTESGALALDKEVLGDIDHPLAKTVLRRRQLDKIRSTYLEHYVTHHRDGRIHPSINALGARTGRMSVSAPNFQNLPRVSEGDKAASVVRNCVVARDGHLLLFCDFSQIETRLLAHLSEDEGLIGAFHLPEDFFVTLARRVFNDDTIGKKDPRRNAIKTWVYAKIYGAGLEKLAKTLGMSPAEMSVFDRSISNAYPGIRRFQDMVQQVARRRLQEEGEPYYICPMSGRRHVADVGKEYALVNYLIQGMAAFFFKKKLLELDAAGLGEWMILPVHDEIILEVPIAHVEDAAQTLIKIMNDPFTFRVPVEAEVSYGQRWGEKYDWKSWQGDPDMM